jgi:hypothetical protein
MHFAILMISVGGQKVELKIYLKKQKTKKQLIYFHYFFTMNLFILKLKFLLLGLSGNDKNDSETKYYTKKVEFIGKWIAVNAVFSFLLIALNNLWFVEGYVLISVGCYGTLIILIKFIFAFLNIIIHHLKKMCCYN